MSPLSLPTSNVVTTTTRISIVVGAVVPPLAEPSPTKIAPATRAHRASPQFIRSFLPLYRRTETLPGFRRLGQTPQRLKKHCHPMRSRRIPIGNRTLAAASSFLSGAPSFSRFMREGGTLTSSHKPGTRESLPQSCRRVGHFPSCKNDSKNSPRQTLALNEKRGPQGPRLNYPVHLLVSWLPAIVGIVLRHGCRHVRCLRA